MNMIDDLRRAGRMGVADEDLLMLDAAEMLEQCRTALASILCAGESGSPTEREARKLCADALVKLNTELNK